MPIHKKAGYNLFFIGMQVLDIDNIDLAMGKMMEQGPVLVITFNSQQILCVRDRTGKVIEGSPDKVRSGVKQLQF
jgi:import inner membrane translocase subunit TIM44